MATIFGAAAAGGYVKINGHSSPVRPIAIHGRQVPLDELSHVGKRGSESGPAFMIVAICAARGSLGIFAVLFAASRNTELN